MTLDLDLVFNGMIGICFLGISMCLFFGVLTSPLRFFHYIGMVFGILIGTCGVARFSRLAAFLFGLSHAQAMMLINLTDGISALVGLAAMIAIIWITISMNKLKRKEVS